MIQVIAPIEKWSTTETRFIKDLLYLDTFLLTFRHFIHPSELIVHLREKYLHEEASQQRSMVADKPGLIMHRIVSFLKKWVSSEESI